MKGIFFPIPCAGRRRRVSEGLQGRSCRKAVHSSITETESKEKFRPNILWLNGWKSRHQFQRNRENQFKMVPIPDAITKAVVCTGFAVCTDSGGIPLVQLAKKWGQGQQSAHSWAFAPATRKMIGRAVRTYPTSLLRIGMMTSQGFPGYGYHRCPTFIVPFPAVSAGTAFSRLLSSSFPASQSSSGQTGAGLPLGPYQESMAQARPVANSSSTAVL